MKDGFFAKLLIAFVLIFLMAILLSLPTMLLWNYLCPDLFRLPQIDIWQALCLNILCGILFKSHMPSKKD